MRYNYILALIYTEPTFRGNSYYFFTIKHHFLPFYCYVQFYMFLYIRSGSNDHDEV